MPSPDYRYSKVMGNLASVTDFWKKLPPLFVLDNGKIQEKT
jgi:hypothetical protein